MIRPARSLRRWNASRFLPRVLVGACALSLTLSSTLLAEVRIKDVTTIDGVRANQLTGMGLVTGLSNTGGKSPTTREFSVNFLQRFGVRIDPAVRAALRNDTTLKTNNLSVVTVTADLPAFARPGARIDVIVSTFDDASSLNGGVLVMTPLIGADGQVYAVASGPISTGGFSFSGEASSVQKNHPTTGRIPNGGIVELETITHLGVNGCIQLLLKSPDFETSRRIATAINQAELLPDLPGFGLAQAIDSNAVRVQVPPQFQGSETEFIGLLGSLSVQPDTIARVIINERTGTIIIGEHVRLSRVLINHANLAISTSESPEVSQPNPFSNGETKEVPRTQITVTEEKAPIFDVESTTSVGDLARALNALAVAPRDLSSILQQLKESGALHAEIEIK